MSRLKIDGVSKKYNETLILEKFSFETKENEFVVIVGPSGCGKTTLLNIIAGLDAPNEGKIEVDGIDITKCDARCRNVAMVFQDYALYPNMTVEENIGFYLKLHGVKKDCRTQAVEKVAHSLNIQELLKRKPDTLSGGQKQRVAIARAIIRKPNIFLFDEPLSNLDFSLREEMRSELAELHKTIDAVFLYVTHDQVEAMSLADRVLVINDHGIQQFDTPETLYNYPCNVFVASFIGTPQINFVSKRMYQCLCPDYDASIEKQNAVIGIRSEFISVVFNENDDNSTFTCYHRELLGKEYLLRMIAHDEIIVISCPSNMKVPNVGDHCSCYAYNRNFYFFDANTGNRLPSTNDSLKCQHA